MAVLDDRKTKEQLIHELQSLRHKVDNVERQLVDLNHAHDEVTVDLSTERKRAEQRFQIIANTCPVGVAISRITDGTILFANQQHADYLRMSVENLVGRKTPDFYVDPEDRKLMIKTIKKVGKISNHELRFYRADGSILWTQFSSQIMELGGEEVLLSAFMDVSDRKRAEDALRQAKDELEQRVEERTQHLRESEERYRAVVEDQTELIRRTTPEGVLTFVNDAYCRYFDKAREELIGQSFLPLVPEQDRARVLEGMTKLDRENSSSTTEHRIVDPDGRVRWQEWTVRALFDTGGKVEQLQAVGHDITERKQAEEVLRESEERFKAVVDNSPSIIVLKDTNSRLLMVNRRFEEVNGLTNDEARGKTPDEFLPKEPADVLFVMDREVIEGCCVVERELELKQQDGSVRTRIVTKFPVCGPTGDVIAIGGVITDITERKKVEAELRHAQRMEAVGLLTGGVAHDFNNLLAIILGNAELLKESLGDDGELAEDVIDAATRGAELTHQLLAFSRRQPLKPAVIDLNA